MFLYIHISFSSSALWKLFAHETVNEFVFITVFDFIVLAAACMIVLILS
jgi:hypothetical protein